MEVGRIGESGQKTKDHDEFQKLRAHQREAAPAPPPVGPGGNARTVLAGKDSFHRADARPCLLCSVPADFDSQRAAPAGTSLRLWRPFREEKYLDRSAFSWKWPTIRYPKSFTSASSAFLVNLTRSGLARIHERRAICFPGTDLRTGQQGLKKEKLFAADSTLRQRVDPFPQVSRSRFFHTADQSSGGVSLGLG
jgi:hypothetical protein